MVNSPGNDRLPKQSARHFVKSKVTGALFYWHVFDEAGVDSRRHPGRSKGSLREAPDREYAIRRPSIGFAWGCFALRLVTMRVVSLRILVGSLNPATNC